MQLRELQGRLESIYEIELDHSIEDFITTDGELVNHLTNDGRACREQLLLQQRGNEISISLYLDPEVYSRFKEHYAN